jgi:hypothetical protein
LLIKTARQHFDRRRLVLVSQIKTDYLGRFLVRSIVELQDRRSRRLKEGIAGVESLFGLDMSGMKKDDMGGMKK